MTPVGFAVILGIATNLGGNKVIDEEGLQIAVAEAAGKAAAAIVIQSALFGFLIGRDVLAIEDAAVISANAGQLLATQSELSAEAKAMAERVLSGFAKTWSKRVTSN